MDETREWLDKNNLYDALIRAARWHGDGLLREFLSGDPAARRYLTRQFPVLWCLMHPQTD